jgi:hypothetical protein
MDAPTLSPKIEMNIPEDNANVEPPLDPVTSHGVESGLVGSESPPDAAADAESPLDAAADAKSSLDTEGDPEDASDAPDDRAATLDVPMEIEAPCDAPTDPEPPMEPGVPNLLGSSDDSLLELTEPCSSSDQDVSSMGGFRANVGFERLGKVILNNYALLLTSINLVNIFEVTRLSKDEYEVRVFLLLE